MALTLEELDGVVGSSDTCGLSGSTSLQLQFGNEALGPQSDKTLHKSPVYTENKDSWLLKQRDRSPPPPSAQQEAEIADKNN